MFRTDFEYECLRTAEAIQPDDAWTLVQVADHFKRAGSFGKAIETLHRADALGAGLIVQSCIADVHVEMEQFSEALEIYKAIPGADQDRVIRTAIADVYRRSGRFDDALREYDRLIHDGIATDRTVAGRAEIAKRQGQLSIARDLYEQLLESGEFSGKSRAIHGMALANVLLRAGDLNGAYRTIDDVVQAQPFSWHAKALRAAIGGLLGDPGEAIKDLPDLGQAHAFREWVSGYVRGLLLLMLNRYADAREALLRHVE
jgi:tetratricopeptide (TPR) repeat protein